MVESELGVLSSQCLSRRTPDKPTLLREVAGWQDHRNKHHAKADWRFTAHDARADLARVNRKTAAYFFHRLRQIIARRLEDCLPVEGLAEVDESYFGGVRKGKRGRGAAGKVPVFGILKRGGKVTTVMIPMSARTRSFRSSSRRSCSGFDRLYRELSRL